MRGRLNTWPAVKHPLDLGDCKCERREVDFVSVFLKDSYGVLKSKCTEV
jgi:hypothetical protein